MKTRTPDQVLDEIARDQIGQEINLSSDIQAKMRKGYEKQMKTKKLLAGAAALVLVLVVLFSIPSVAKAIGRLFGYVPGTGFVEQSAPIRVLKEPVVFKSGVTTITVSQALIDSEHTTVNYQIENFPDVDATDLQFEDFCHALPSLVREDGSYLDPSTLDGNSWASGLSRQLEYDALPADENSVILEFACLEASPIVADAPKIQMRLEFVTASEEMTSYPLVELPTPTLHASETRLPTDPVSPASQISLVLNKYVQTDQEIILFGAVKTNATDFMLTYADFAAVHLFDKDGNAIPIEEDYTLPDPETETPAVQEILITYRTAGRYIPGEANLVIDSLWVDRAAEASFTFDPGPDPQPGQTWTINQTLEVNGYSILIKEVTKTLRGEGLDVSYETPENISMLRLNDLEHPQLGGGGGSESSGFTYDNGFPTGQITVTLTGYAELITGPWQTAVTLPAFADGTLPTPMPQACLTKATWEAALLSSNREMPVVSGNKLILADILAPDYNYHVLSADLDNLSATDLGLGDGGSLSPDGQTLIYATQEGLKLLALESGEITAVPDTSRRDRGPLWSPDGTQIAFTRGPASGLIGGPGPYDLILMNADGSNQTVLLADNEANYAQTWMPFSNVLLYTVMRPDGAAVKTINTETEKVTWLTDLNYQNAGVAVSPNGRQIAYEAMLPGDKYAIFTASLDGSNARLIANGDPIVVTEPFWSPDGEWLIMSVQDTSLNEYSATLALVNPTTCQIIPMVDLQGYVTSWR